MRFHHRLPCALFILAHRREDERAAAAAAPGTVGSGGRRLRRRRSSLFQSLPKFLGGGGGNDAGNDGGSDPLVAVVDGEAGGSYSYDTLALQGDIAGLEKPLLGDKDEDKGSPPRKASEPEKPEASSGAVCAAPESCRPPSGEASLGAVADCCNRDESYNPLREQQAIPVAGEAEAPFVPYRALPFLSTHRSKIVAGTVFFIGFVGNIIAFVYAGIACHKNKANC